MTSDHSAMRLIFAGLIMLSASAAVVRAGDVDKYAEIKPRHGTVQAPAGNRQATRPDPTGAPAGAGEIQPQDGGLAKVIEQENDRLDRLVRGICRGC